MTSVPFQNKHHPFMNATEMIKLSFTTHKFIMPKNSPGLRMWSALDHNAEQHTASLAGTERVVVAHTHSSAHIRCFWTLSWHVQMCLHMLPQRLTPPPAWPNPFLVITLPSVSYSKCLVTSISYFKGNVPSAILKKNAYACFVLQALSCKFHFYSDWQFWILYKYFKSEIISMR